MKPSYIIIFYFSLIISCNTYAQKIPITSNSKEAIALYIKARDSENFLELDRAEILYHRAIQLDSTFAIAHLRLGMLRDNYDYRNRKLNDALKYIDGVSNGEKLLINARIDVYVQSYDGTNEFEYTKQLVEMYPNDEEANYLFALVNLHHGRSNPEIAITYLKKALALKRNYTLVQSELVNAYMTLNEFKKAEETVRKLIGLLPNSLDPLNTYAEIFMRSGDYSESINQYNKVLVLNDSYPWALMGISTNLNFLDKHAEARTYLNRLVDSTLSDYEYRHKWRAKVVSFLDEGDFKNAVQTLEQQKNESLTKVNTREPTFHIYYSYLRKTKLYFENDDFQNGFQEYLAWNKYVMENFKSEATKSRVTNLKKYYLGYQAYIEGDYNSALKIVAGINKENETDDVKVLRCKIYIKENKFQLAIDAVSQTDLTNPYNQYWLMMANKMHGNTIEALKWKNKIIQLNDRNNIDLALVRKKAELVKL